MPFWSGVHYIIFSLGAKPSYLLLVVGDWLNFIIDHRLESLDAFDAILLIMMGSHIFTEKSTFYALEGNPGTYGFTESLYLFMCKWCVKGHNWFPQYTYNSNPISNLQLDYLLPKAQKKIMSVSSDMSKNIRVGRSGKSFFYFLFFFKKSWPNFFSQLNWLLFHLNNINNTV